MRQGRKANGEVGAPAEASVSGRDAEELEDESDPGPSPQAVPTKHCKSANVATLRTLDAEARKGFGWPLRSQRRCRQGRCCRATGSCSRTWQGLPRGRSRAANGTHHMPLGSCAAALLVSGIWAWPPLQMAMGDPPRQRNAERPPTTNSDPKAGSGAGTAVRGEAQAGDQPGLGSSSQADQRLEAKQLPAALPGGAHAQLRPAKRHRLSKVGIMGRFLHSLQRWRVECSTVLPRLLHPLRGIVMK